MAFLLHQLLSEVTHQHPDREAIIYKDRIVTYAELDAESNKLANLLFSRNVKKGDRIAIFLDRGIESIIAAFGILKAGGVYVPIDPKSPQRRISYIIESCGITSLITVKRKLAVLEKAWGNDNPLEQILLFDGFDANEEDTSILVDVNAVPDDFALYAPDVNIIDTDLAYILFTSGSTGNPKGVMLSHLNALTFVNSAYDFFQINMDDRLSNIAPLHFDMSVFDIYVAIKAGACIVSIPEATTIFPRSLAEYISEKKISVWNSVPSALALLATVEDITSIDFSNLRLILFAGEIFPLKYLRLLQEAIPGARFCNMYGQTEANSSTYYWVDRLPPDFVGVLPIGKTLPNFEVFALDEEGKKVQQAGQEGELFIRASTVAMGYWGDEERSSLSFVKNPLQPNDRRKLYRTGDIVRLDADENYVFIGRKDHMIKSRGYRIEIGEIESVLNSHPKIKLAVVIPIPDELIGNRLTAWVVPIEPGEIAKQEVSKFCITQLPKYMVPEVVEIRESLPMTSSGKVDRQKLKNL